MNDVDALLSHLVLSHPRKESAVTVTVRRLEHSDHEYFAYAKSLCGRATYFLHFQDDIFGAVVLHNFLEMLRRFFEKERVVISIADDPIRLKNDHLLTMLRDYRDADHGPAEQHQAERPTTPTSL